MQFLIVLTLLASFFSVAFSAPVQIAKRAPRTYSQLSIGGGVGGNALAEAQAKFPGTPATLSKATTSDFSADAHCSVLAEQAFIDAGAIASSNRATNGVSVGLFKNKVLKIFGTMVALQAEIAQNGGKASAAQTAQLDDLNAKLAVNVAVDKTNAGLKSQDVSFTC
ncbi:hypothetical protein DFH08DRAFT_926132 [Mycena albidolilacea]|uniref:Uncharacterized protein n=1 Tax=Mycena albidolilacea TaxID=1033008 RepID=A0AAD7EIM0_9AGAR|nr:hypothetical protein DFH08DRAFT_926132 [Mycena albidolilacea]